MAKSCLTEENLAERKRRENRGAWNPATQGETVTEKGELSLCSVLLKVLSRETGVTVLYRVWYLIAILGGQGGG